MEAAPLVRVGTANQTSDPFWASEYKNREHHSQLIPHRCFSVLFSPFWNVSIQEEVLRQRRWDAGCVCHHSPPSGTEDSTQWAVSSGACHGLEHMCLHNSRNRYRKTSSFSFDFVWQAAFLKGYFLVFSENVLQAEEKPIFGSLQNRQVGGWIVVLKRKQMMM